MNNADVPSQPYPRDIMQWSESDVYGPVFSSVTPDGEVSKTKVLTKNVIDCFSTTSQKKHFVLKIIQHYSFPSVP